MSAQIFIFPRQSRSTIRVARDGDWLVTDGNHAWPCSSQAAAIEEALRWARDIRASAIIIEMH